MYLPCDRKKADCLSGICYARRLLELDGKAYVFTAKSGVGKTTHTKLWVEYFEGIASYINGDKPIIRCKDFVWYAYGTPWMGKEKFEVKVLRRFRQFALLNGGEENKIQKDC